jgi:hypothetical protein
LLHFLSDAIESVGRSELQVNAIHIADELEGVLFSEVLLQVASYVRGEGHLTIAEGAGSAQPADQVAGYTGKAVDVPV